MGLDVYLKRCNDWEDVLHRQREYERLSEENFERAKAAAGVEGLSYNDMTDEQRTKWFAEADKLNKPLEEQFSVSEYGETDEIESVTIPQDFMGYERPEDHIFEIGYFRSSYNNSGINHLSDIHGFPGLYAIFPEAESHDAYYVPVHWQAALNRVVSAQDMIRDIMRERPENVYVLSVTPNIFMEPPNVRSEADALEIFYEQARQWKTRDRMFGTGYTNRDGQFDSEGLKVKALIPGIDTTFRTERPCTYVVVEYSKDFDPLAWCLDAYHMVELTIRWVLEQDKPETYRLAWSA
jgi:hypothetical protein